MRFLNQNINDFGRYFEQSFEAQITMFPKMVNEKIWGVISKYKNKAYGWKLSGAGGGGYFNSCNRQPYPPIPLISKFVEGN